MRGNRAWLPALSVLAALAVLAGCNGDDDRDTNPAPTSAAAATTSPATAPAATPAAIATTPAPAATTPVAVAAATTPRPAATAPPAVATTPRAVGTTFTPGVRETEIEDFAFETPLRVAAGTTVTWKNRDGVDHTVTARNGSFDSRSIAKDGTFSRAFAQAGRFEYFCSIHPTMTGVVEVQ